MDYENVYQARFSDNYLLRIWEDRFKVWRVQVDGPCPIVGSLTSSNLPDAQGEAYSFADQHFLQKGIAEPKKPKGQVKWVALP